MVNPSNLTTEGKQQFEKEVRENLEQLHHFPSITTWVLFNEKWGQYDQERLTKWMKESRSQSSRQWPFRRDPVRERSAAQSITQCLDRGRYD